MKWFDEMRHDELTRRHYNQQKGPSNNCQGHPSLSWEIYMGTKEEGGVFCNLFECTKPQNFTR
jgi:hypothetical protein